MSDHAPLLNKRYDATPFDAGYTLLRPVREAAMLVADHLVRLGIDVDPEPVALAWRRAERLFLEDYFSPRSMTWTSDARVHQLYRRYYHQLLADLGVADPDYEHSDTIIRDYNDPTNWETYPGVGEALAELRRRGYGLGVVSDWVSTLPRILRRLDLTRHLDWALISGSIGFSKPTPAFYQLAVQRAGVPADRIVHVGDSYYADVRGAYTVGMDAILIDWQHRSWPPLDVPLVHSLDELLELL